MAGSPSLQLPGGAKTRGDINIFLLGDAGTAKSEMLKACKRAAPRGLYTSGRGSSGAGLTVAVTKDKNGMMQLEAGAMVLGDRGVVCIDEFDKLRDEDRSALHEAMEGQAVSVAKAGIVATLHARAPVFAAANPIGGVYDMYKTIVDNTKVPIPLLSRFDLIWIVRDIPDQARDGRIADHLLDMYGGAGGGNNIEPEMLTKYIAYVQQNVHPEMQPAAKARIKEYFLALRKGDPKETKAAIRQLQGLYRLATARARTRGSGTVDEEDAERAILLTDESLKQSGRDPETGTVDLMVLQGKGSTEVKRAERFMDLLQNIESQRPEGVPVEHLVEDMVTDGLFDAPGDARRFVDKMIQKDAIYEPKDGHIKRVC